MSENVTIIQSELREFFSDIYAITNSETAAL